MASRAGITHHQSPINHLTGSASPYLRQHADNPVDWWPWADEAFEEARRRDVPVFLSIGYATCHWCHVMAHESFEHEPTAALLNEAFVCVKVDREERPDVDAIHMAVCQAMTGQGGWPLTVLLTPARRPFFAGTYIPRESRSGRIGLTEWIPLVAEAWQAKRTDIDATADNITEALAEAMAARPAPAAPDAATLALATRRLLERYDAVNGGFGNAPKFPTPHNLLFLLQTAWRTGDAAAKDAAVRTLRAMARGGIRDHLGGGFHRYSTDARWLLPHFEKMLSDQAMLALAYVEGYLASGAAELRETAEDTLDYVLRYLATPAGAFASAEDADSLAPDGRTVEGAFYTWTEAELAGALGDDDLHIARALYGTEPDGNFADEATGHKTGENVLHRALDLDVVAARVGVRTPVLEERAGTIRERLLAARARRQRPALDDKVLADWNGLAIAALARAGRAFGDVRWTDAAGAAAQYLLREMRRPDGSLLHAGRAGEVGIDGMLDDYAFVTWGLVELYQATGDAGLLGTALHLHRLGDERFADSAGGWYMSAADASDLVVRPRESYDGAVPSGQSVMAWNGLRLARMTGDWTLEESALRALASDAGVAAYPDGHTFWMTALGFAVGPAAEVVIAGAGAAADTRAMREALDRAWAPNAVVLYRDPGAGAAPVAAMAPFTEAQTAIDGAATAYVCERHACRAPTTDPADVTAALAPAR